MKASILILCWNHENYVRQCLESVLKQSYKDIEIIFLDNVSKDNSFGIAKSVLESSGIPYQLYINDSPQSVAKNLNFLVDKASGEYIFPFSSDDWMAPENISEKMALLKSKPDVGLVFGGGWLYFEDTRNYIEVDVSKFKKENMVQNLLLDRASYFYIGCGYKKSIIIELGKWDENLLVEDLDFNLRLAIKYQLDFVPKPLVYYRKHSASFLSNYNLMLKGFIQYYEKYKNDKRLPINKWMSENYKFFAFEALDNNQYTQSISFLHKSFIFHPSIGIVKTSGIMLRKCLSKIHLLQKMWQLRKKTFN